MSNIRKYFTSRWEHGFIAEYDFSQLEVIVLAHLSGDKNLIADIKTGVDMHCMSASFLYNTHYQTIKDAYDNGDSEWTKRRKKAKPCGFLLQYGGGATAMSKATGLSVPECRKFIINYYKRYTGVKQWQEDVALVVKATRVLSSKRTPKGVPAGKGTFTSITGRRYTFIEDDDFHGGTSFSPTKMKNYPVQGFATGDIVPLVLGKLFRVLKNHDTLAEKCLMINTVHDSIVFDIDCLETLRIADKVIRETMEKAPQYLKETFDIDFKLELPVDGDAGKNWLDMEPVDAWIAPF